MCQPHWVWLIQQATVLSYSMADGRRRCFTHGSKGACPQIGDKWEMYLTAKYCQKFYVARSCGNGLSGKKEHGTRQLYPLINLDN